MSTTIAVPLWLALLLPLWMCQPVVLILSLVVATADAPAGKLTISSVIPLGRFSVKFVSGVGTTLGRGVDVTVATSTLVELNFSSITCFKIVRAHFKASFIVID